MQMSIVARCSEYQDAADLTHRCQTALTHDIFYYFVFLCVFHITKPPFLQGLLAFWFPVWTPLLYAMQGTACGV